MPMLVTIVVLKGLKLGEAARRWWDAARQAHSVPLELRPLIAGDAERVEVTSDRARDLRAWCASLGGWDPARAALRFVALRGRPRTSRRSSGGRVHVRLSEAELAAIQSLGGARGGISDAEVVRCSALLELKREAARQAVEGHFAEAVPVEALAVDDLVWPDAVKLALRGGAARVVALRQENELWCVELADPPIWLAAGTRIWRRRRR